MNGFDKPTLIMWRIILKLIDASSTTEYLEPDNPCEVFAIFLNFMLDKVFPLAAGSLHELLTQCLGSKD